MNRPTVVIHGGAGRALSDGGREAAVREALGEIVERLWQRVCQGEEAMAIAQMGCVALEDCEHFNAGLGSAVQSDGQVRMSASIMDGQRRSFSGVINVESVQNPVTMAVRLQRERDRVLDAGGAQRLAREMGLAHFDPIVERRLAEWWKEKQRGMTKEQADVSPADEDSNLGMGTVGVVVRDGKGQLAASTSTGGRGFERPGRVSDSATVAGNYATDRAAVSCTGIGEDINDEALAARVVVEVEGGRPLDEALSRAIEGARSRQRRLAAIAVDHQGQMGWAKTTELLLAVGRNAEETRWAF